VRRKWTKDEELIVDFASKRDVKMSCVLTKIDKLSRNELQKQKAVWIKTSHQKEDYFNFVSVLKKIGVKIKDTYLTMGRYDLICIIDAPDDETYATAILQLGSQGNVQTETLKAFSEADYRKIIGSI